MRAKAIQTIGPASKSQPVLERVIGRGQMQAARLNCSHAVTSSHYHEFLEVAATIRRLAVQSGQHVSIFYDTPGHKIRITGINEPVPLKEGMIVTFSDTYAGLIRCTQPGYLELGEVGRKVYIGDGGADDPQLTILDKDHGLLKCQVNSGKKLEPRKGLTIEGAKVSLLGLPAVSEADVVAIKAAIEANADYIGMSYGTHASQFQTFIDTARRLGAKPGTKFVFKYELGETEKDLDRIVELADAMYLGQGDLNLSVPYWEVVRHRDRVIQACQAAGKECWVGTGLLMSMVKGSIPKPGEFAGLLQVLKAGATALVLSDEFTVANDPAASAAVLYNSILMANGETIAV